MSDSRTLLLNSGRHIPVIALGTYKVNNDCGDIERAVKEAIDVGYRHFDCAWIYGNEEEVGTAIKYQIAEGVVTRDELFLTTKVWNNYHSRDKVVNMLHSSLLAMKLPYIDLYLIHWPVSFKETSKLLPLTDGSKAYSDIDYLETWKGMEDCVRIGLTKSIGLANFNSQQIDRILKHAIIPPAVNQIEVNLNFNQQRLIRFCQDRGIEVIGYYPLGLQELSSIPGVMEPPIHDPMVYDIAKKYERSPSQIILNYLVSKGICVVLKTASKFRLVEHLNVFDFKLKLEDVAVLDTCKQQRRNCSFGAFFDHPHYPFHIEF